MLTGGRVDLAPANRSDEGEQAAPIMHEDEDKEAHQQRKCGRHGLPADDWLENAAETLDQSLDNGLTARRDYSRFTDKPANQEDQQQGDDPARCHGVCHWHGTQLKERLGLGRNPVFTGKGGQTGSRNKGKESQYSNQGHCTWTVKEWIKKDKC